MPAEGMSCVVGPGLDERRTGDMIQPVLQGEVQTAESRHWTIVMPCGLFLPEEPESHERPELSRGLELPEELGLVVAVSWG